MLDLRHGPQADAVLTYHVNPMTCGVARFNRALAEHLGIPFQPLLERDSRGFRAPLLSIKLSEFTPEDAERLAVWTAELPVVCRPSLFFHDFSDSPVEHALIKRSTHVFCGNEHLKHRLNGLHPQVVEAWCPGYLFDTRPLRTRSELSVYTYGMSHKLRAEPYVQLQRLLEASGREYIVYVSTAIHEGRTLDHSFTDSVARLEEIFGDHVVFLGFVSDRVLHHYLTNVTIFAAFFESGVRANNTSVNTAMRHGAVVLTNLDEYSPPEYVHGVSVLDVARCAREGLPLDPAVLRSIGDAGVAVAEIYGWDALRRRLQGLPAAAE